VANEQHLHVSLKGVKDVFNLVFGEHVIAEPGHTKGRKVQVNNCAGNCVVSSAHNDGTTHGTCEQTTHTPQCKHTNASDHRTKYQTGQQRRRKCGQHQPRTRSEPKQQQRFTGVASSQPTEYQQCLGKWHLSQTRSGHACPRKTSSTVGSEPVAHAHPKETNMPREHTHVTSSNSVILWGWQRNRLER
jgi:hypothetical protein